MRISDNVNAITAIVIVATGAADGAIVGLIARNAAFGIAFGVIAAGVIGLVMRFFQLQPRIEDDCVTYPVDNA